MNKTYADPGLEVDILENLGPIRIGAIRRPLMIKTYGVSEAAYDLVISRRIGHADDVFFTAIPLITNFEGIPATPILLGSGWDELAKWRTKLETKYGLIGSALVPWAQLPGPLKGLSIIFEDDHSPVQTRASHALERLEHFKDRGMTRNYQEHQLKMGRINSLDSEHYDPALGSVVAYALYTEIRTYRPGTFGHDPGPATW